MLQGPSGLTLTSVRVLSKPRRAAGPRKLLRLHGSGGAWADPEQQQQQQQQETRQQHHYASATAAPLGWEGAEAAMEAPHDDDAVRLGGDGGRDTAALRLSGRQEAEWRHYSEVVAAAGDDEEEAAGLESVLVESRWERVRRPASCPELLALAGVFSLAAAAGAGRQQERPVLPAGCLPRLPLLPLRSARGAPLPLPLLLQPCCCPRWSRWRTGANGSCSRSRSRARAHPDACRSPC